MPPTVLLCDTADEVSRLQYELLRAAPDLPVEVTTDAFTAVETAVRLRPDVVITELGLEGLGGAELIRRLKASSPGSRVVAWTRNGEPERVAEALGAGASGYLLKTDGTAEVLAALRQPGGVVLSATVASRMATELTATIGRVRELEVEVDGVRRNVESGTSAKADFLANISHELRTPVTVAKGIAYVLRNPSVPESERDEFLAQLQTSLDKLMGIVDEIITLSELERGTFELEIATVDLAPLVRHAVDDVSRQYPMVTIDAEIPDSLPAVADGPRIGGVVRELLDNGCRYSPAGVPVELRARMLDEGVVVSITDRGEGLDRAMAMKAFQQPFSTGEGVLRKEKAGVGVGLHLARQLIVEHGGIMWTDPLAGGGTRVAFCVPAHAGDRLSERPAGAA
jgi:signal transduction histidine kinase